jgi:CHASE3 domain sensor protein
LTRTNQHTTLVLCQRQAARDMILAVAGIEPDPATGVVFAMSYSLRGMAWTAFALAVALLIGSSVFLYRATRKLTASEVLVAHTHEVETVLQELGSDVLQASNSARAFVLTEDDSLLQGYRYAIKDIPDTFNRLHHLMADNPGQGENLNRLQADIETELGLISRSIQAHRRGLSSMDSDAEIARQTEALGNQIQQTLQKVEDGEDQQLEQRQAVSRANYHHTLNLIGVSFLAALVLLGAQMFSLNYAFTQYRRTESAAQQDQETVNPREERIANAFWRPRGGFSDDR